MKVRITERKAPWPQGAKVGEVVDFEGDTVPGWAQGKCHPVDDDIEAQHQYEPPGAIRVPKAAPASKSDGDLKVLIAGVESLSLDVTSLRSQLELQGATVGQLIEDVKTGVALERSLLDQLADAINLAGTEKARADELQAKLAAAEQAAAEAATAKGAKK
ncbi:hypothetical protein [Comamonas testosteroni]|uniref:hypothetical protein n=1 Tax=Comamonas testosteroni TaxID=285 RepID=UPI0006B8F07A|nr:hypothetical protein [Comamonas testosteroni]